jgi:anti-sigma-K factor RskA
VESVKEYIESGILELYVLGDLNAEERSDVEAMSKLYPEVKAELEEIEVIMSTIGEDLTLEPSSKVKEQFFNSISFADEIDQKIEDEEPKEARIIPLNNSKLNFYKLSLAACLALLLVSVVAIVNLNNNLKNSKQQIAQLQTSNQSFANRVNYLDKSVTESNEALNVFTDADFKMVKLNGTANSPESNLLIAFNPKEQKVIIHLRSMKMPENDKEHQYQLWALVDGKPVDLGVFDADNKVAILKSMKSIEVAQAFAVTLEPTGGSVSPTMDKMMVMGAI